MRFTWGDADGLASMLWNRWVMFIDGTEVPLHKVRIRQNTVDIEKTNPYVVVINGREYTRCDTLEEAQAVAQTLYLLGEI